MHKNNTYQLPSPKTYPRRNVIDVDYLSPLTGRGDNMRFTYGMIAFVEYSFQPYGDVFDYEEEFAYT